MRTQILKGIGTALVLGATMFLSVGAQAADVRAKVPFSFAVNKTVLPPGTYDITSGSTAGTLMIRGFGANAVTLSNRTESLKVQAPKLVFHRYGDTYILREVWTGSGVGRMLPESKRERELASGRSGAATASLERVEIPIL